jgi:hypothetical protein
MIRISISSLFTQLPDRTDSLVQSILNQRTLILGSNRGPTTLRKSEGSGGLITVQIGGISVQRRTVSPAQIRKMRAAGSGYEYISCRRVPTNMKGPAGRCRAFLGEEWIVHARSSGYSGMPVLEVRLVGIPAFCSNRIPVGNEPGDHDIIQFLLDEGAEHVADRVFGLLDTHPLFRLKKRVRQHLPWDSIFQQQILPLIIRRKIWGL